MKGGFIPSNEPGFKTVTENKPLPTDYLGSNVEDPDYEGIRNARAAAALEGDEGMLYKAPKEKIDHTGKTDSYQGKAREKWHPLDKKSGTGKGKELQKHGHGKNNWGDITDEIIMGNQLAREAEDVTEVSGTIEKKVSTIDQDELEKQQI